MKYFYQAHFVISNRHWSEVLVESQCIDNPISSVMDLRTGQSRDLGGGGACLTRVQEPQQRSKEAKY